MGAHAASVRPVNNLINRNDLSVSEDVKTPTSVTKTVPSLLETIVEGRFLLLLLCFVFYLDIWLIQSGVNPTALTLKASYGALLSVSVFSFLLFIGSYSLLMVGFFPTLRQLIGFLRIYFQSQIHFSKESVEGRRLADWSLAFVCLSAYSGILGFFFSEGEYRGLAVYILTFLTADGIAEGLFRLCVFVLWFFCFALAVRVDGLDD